MIEELSIVFENLSMSEVLSLRCFVPRLVLLRVLRFEHVRGNEVFPWLQEDFNVSLEAGRSILHLLKFV